MFSRCEIHVSRRCVSYSAKDFRNIRKLQNIQRPPSLDRLYPYCATYDIECLMKKNASKPNCEKQCWITEHEIMSVTVCSNVQSYKNAECFVSNGLPAALTDTFLSYILEGKGFQRPLLKYQPVLDKLEEQIQEKAFRNGRS